VDQVLKKIDLIGVTKGPKGSEIMSSHVGITKTSNLWARSSAVIKVFCALTQVYTN